MGYSHKRLKICAKGVSIFLMGLLLIYLSGCSTAHHYKLLTFFFDGVPNPEKVVMVASNDSLGRQDSVALALNSPEGKGPRMNYHPPYKDKDCASCHDESKTGNLVKPLPDLCYQCHEDFAKKYRVLHGPVGGGQCTACHSPHLSANATLLTRTAQNLCLYCHESGRVMKSEAHSGIKDVDCTECHNPHGGEDRYVLR